MGGAGRIRSLGERLCGGQDCSEETCCICGSQKCFPFKTNQDKHVTPPSLFLHHESNKTN